MKKKKKILKPVLSSIIFGIVGGIIGMISAKYFDDFAGIDIYSGDIPVDIFYVSIIVLVFFTANLIHIIIHEAGHLIFGLMTGYSFISFRIGSFTIIEEDGKLKIKRFNLPGTAGQCLMMPPESKDGEYPFVIYNLGGVIMNLVLAIMAIWISISIERIVFPWNGLLFAFGAVGIFVGVTNGVPMKIGGISNDGHNILSMLKDEDARKSFHLQLRINGLLSGGIRIKDMPLDTFKLKEDADLSSPLNTAIGLMEYNWYLDNMDLEEARRCIDSFKPYLDKVIPLYRNEINCERMFLDLVGDCDKDFIDNIYDKDLKNYVKRAKYMIGKKRLLMAYEGFYNKRKDKASKYYKELKGLAKKYPIKGEAEMELMLGDWIWDELEGLAI
ncbi:MAG: hypothetical protein GX320_00705 [Tissierellia bacterium]|nr:hypothetical protein [Tissierellia bacterium]